MKHWTFRVTPIAGILFIIIHGSNKSLLSLQWPNLFTFFLFNENNVIIFDQNLNHGIQYIHDNHTFFLIYRLIRDHNKMNMITILVSWLIRPVSLYNCACVCSRTLFFFFEKYVNIWSRHWIFNTPFEKHHRHCKLLNTLKFGRKIHRIVWWDICERYTFIDVIHIFFNFFLQEKHLLVLSELDRRKNQCIFIMNRLDSKILRNEDIWIRYGKGVLRYKIKWSLVND